MSMKVSKYFEEQLDKMVEDFVNVKERRGMGLLQGLVLLNPVSVYWQKQWKRELTLFLQVEMY